MYCEGSITIMWSPFTPMISLYLPASKKSVLSSNQSPTSASSLSLSSVIWY